MDEIFVYATTVKGLFDRVVAVFEKFHKKEEYLHIS